MFRSALVGPTTTVPHILISIFKYNVVHFVKPEAGYIFCTKFFNTSCYFSGIKIILYRLTSENSNFDLINLDEVKAILEY